MIPALVLTAGLGTRFRPLSFVRAKAAAPVAGEPLIRRILRTLAAADVVDVVLNLHHLPHTIAGLVGDGRDLGLRVRYSWEMPALGSAGGPRHALALLDRSPFLIVNGDTLTDADIGALVDDHARTGALATLAVIPNTEPDRYGGVLVDSDGIVTGFNARGSREASYHFIGVQVANADAFSSLPDNVPYETTRRLYPDLIRSRPGSVRAWVTPSHFFDIGTPADYFNTTLRISAREGVGLTIGARSRIAADAQVIDSIVWDDVDIGAGAMVRECIITDNVRVPADTSWTGVTIRVASDEQHPGERIIEGLAIGSF